MTTISVITPSLNQVDLLVSVIENVRGQVGADIEHIVIDGGSTDGTIDVLRGYGNDVTWVSEPDTGQADAINKGFAMARGDVLAWLNCDDAYTPGTLRLVSELFAGEPALEFLYGDALGADLKGRLYGRRAHVRACSLQDLVNEGDPIVQPAAFWRRSLWQEVGALDTSLTYAFDYEWWMRAASVAQLTYVPVCFAVETLHADAKTSRGGGQPHERDQVRRLAAWRCWRTSRISCRGGCT